MTTMTDAHASLASLGAKSRDGWVQRLQRALEIAAVLAGAFLGTHLLVMATQTPGQLVRSDLVGAAKIVRSSPMTTPKERVQLGVQNYLSDRRTTVDPSAFPVAVLVTLRGLDRDVCIDAATVARRINGLAVVELQNPAFPAECGERNDMTWRILP